MEKKKFIGHKLITIPLFTIATIVIHISKNLSWLNLILGYKLDSTISHFHYSCLRPFLEVSISHGVTITSNTLYLHICLLLIQTLPFRCSRDLFIFESTAAWLKNPFQFEIFRMLNAVDVAVSVEVLN